MDKITILTDKSSWMNEYNIKLKEQLSLIGCDVKLISSKKELEKGDIAFFLSCFEIIPDEYLALNKHNIVVHASDLPKGKGWSPTTWQILEGKNEIPLTLFEAVSEMDAGDFYMKDILLLNGDELIDEWQKKLGEKIIEMCVNYVKKCKEIKGEKQIGESSFYKKRTGQNNEMDINKTILEQFNLLRVVDNEKYPAFFIKDGVKYILKITKEKND